MKPHASRPAATALAATFAVQTLASMSMFGVSVVAPVAAPEIGVPATLVGVFTAVAYGAGLVAGLLAGAFADRYGAIRICQVTMGLALLGCAALAVSTPAAAAVSAVLLGLCYGPVNPASTHILARVTPAQSRPLYFSIKQTGMPAGVAIAGVLLPWLVAGFGWRTAMLAIGGLAVAVAAAVQPLRRSLDAVRDPRRPVRAGNLVAPLRLVWREPRLRCLAIMGFVFSGSQVAIMTFYVVYLTSSLHMSLTAAGLVYTTLQLSAVAGRLFWGAVADRFIAAATVLGGIGLATAVFSVSAGLFSESWPVWALVAVSCGLGATSSGWNGVFFAEMVKYAPEGRTGDAAGGLQFATLLGVSVVPPTFGAIVAGGGYLMAFACVAGATIAIAVYLHRTLRAR